jgi:hypothetical protein
MGVRPNLPLPTRRLLNHAEAASYCGLTENVFDRTCPIVPISLAQGVRRDNRLLRYDVVALDEWIDILSGRAVGAITRKPTDGAYD